MWSKEQSQPYPHINREQKLGMLEVLLKFTKTICYIVAPLAARVGVSDNLDKNDDLMMP